MAQVTSVAGNLVNLSISAVAVKGRLHARVKIQLLVHGEKTWFVKVT